MREELFIVSTTDTEKIEDQYKAHFLTFKMGNWAAVFSTISYKNMMADKLNSTIRNKNMVVHGYIINKDEIHLIARSKDGSLSEAVRYFRREVARAIRKELHPLDEHQKEWVIDQLEHAAQKKSYQDYLTSSHGPKVIDTELLKQEMIHFIHNTPYDKKREQKARHHQYSSAIDYAGGIGPVKVRKYRLEKIDRLFELDVEVDVEIDEG